MNERHYWFKRRRYGWGWIPVTWQGWGMLVGLVGVVVLAALILLPGTPRHTLSKQVVEFFVVLIGAVVLFIIISAQKAPTPHWRWGKKDTDNPDEDW